MQCFLSGLGSRRPAGRAAAVPTRRAQIVTGGSPASQTTEFVVVFYTSRLLRVSPFQTAVAGGDGWVGTILIFQTPPPSPLSCFASPSLPCVGGSPRAYAPGIVVAGRPFLFFFAGSPGARSVVRCTPSSCCPSHEKRRIDV